MRRSSSYTLIPEAAEAHAEAEAYDVQPLFAKSKSRISFVAFVVAAFVVLILRYSLQSAFSDSPALSHSLVAPSSSRSLSVLPESIPINPSIPPPTRWFRWCFNCTTRCANVLDSILYHSSGLKARDRLMKLREMASALPKFFRGSDHIFLEDVYNIPRDSSFWRFSSPRTRTFVNADMHLFNFGSFDNYWGEVLYAMNDFDQTLIGDYEVDMWRTGTSLVVHMEINGISAREQENILRSYARTYWQTVYSFIGNHNELIFYLNATNSFGPVQEFVIQQQLSQSRMRMLSRFTYFDRNGIRRLQLDRPDLEAPEPKAVEELQANWGNYLNTLGACHRAGHSLKYSRPRWVGVWEKANVTKEFFFAIKSIAARVGAGLGSLGQPRWFVLVEGPSTSQHDDVLLDVKREPVPEWWNFVHEEIRWYNSFFRSQGHRIATAMHALDMHVDPTVGWMELSDGSYIVRQRSPFKGNVDIDSLLTPERFQQLSDQYAIITAGSHCRGDNDYSESFVVNSFEAEFAKVAPPDQLKAFEDNFIRFSYMNAERTAEDFQCFIRSGLAEDPEEFIRRDLESELKDENGGAGIETIKAADKQEGNGKHKAAKKDGEDKPKRHRQ